MARPFSTTALASRRFLGRFLLTIQLGCSSKAFVRTVATWFFFNSKFHLDPLFGCLAQPRALSCFGILSRWLLECLSAFLQIFVFEKHAMQCGSAAGIFPAGLRSSLIRQFFSQSLACGNLSNCFTLVAANALAHFRKAKSIFFSTRFCVAYFGPPDFPGPGQIRWG